MRRDRRGMPPCSSLSRMWISGTGIHTGRILIPPWSHHNMALIGLTRPLPDKDQHVAVWTRNFTSWEKLQRCTRRIYNKWTNAHAIHKKMKYYILLRKTKNWPRISPTIEILVRRYCEYEVAVFPVAIRLAQHHRTSDRLIQIGHLPRKILSTTTYW